MNDTARPAPGDLTALVRAESAHPASTAALAMVDAIRARFGSDLFGILFYGSCRRSAAPEGLLDFYVVLDGTRSLGRFESALLVALPPNVYYLECPLEGARVADARVRSKVTVVTRGAFRRGTSGRWFHSYLWGRFSQPTSIVWARDPAARQELEDALARATVTFLRRVLPLLGTTFSAADLWTTGLGTSYRTELRSERAAKLARLYADEADYLDAVTRAGAAAAGFAMPVDGVFTNPLSPARRRLGRAAWRVRMVTGTLLSFLRILKSAWTFDGGLDYAVWKLERQSGRTIPIPPEVRARPWRHAPAFFWRLYREGVFR